MADLAILGMLVAVALGVGRRCLRAVPFAWPLEEGLCAVALGLGLLAYATLALGEVRWLTRPALAVVIAAAAVYGRREVRAGLASAVRGTARWWRDRPPAVEAAGVALGVALLGAEIVLVLAPAVGGDQTKYQLVYPRLYAEAGRLVDTPWSFWGYVQYVMNMLYTAAFVLRGDVLARLLNAVFGVLATLAVFALGRRLLGRRVATWSALLFATMPLSATLMVRAWAEMALATYVLLAVLAVLAWRESESRAWLALGAVMAGFATGTKIMGALVPSVLGLVVLTRMVAGRGRAALGPALATTVAFGSLAVVVASPCYLRNWVATGNPIFPFGYGVFGGRNWSAEAARGLDAYYAAYRESGARRRAGGGYDSWLETLRFPWDVTMAPHSFEEAGRSAYDIGPFLLAFVPAIWLVWREPGVRIVTMVAGVYVAAVTFGMWAHPRYVHPALPLLLVVAAGGIDALRRHGPAASRAVTAVLAVTVLVQAGLAARVVAPLVPDSARVVLGRMSEDAFLRRYERRYELWSLVNAEVPPDGNVLVLGMIPHPYHLERRFTLASPLEQGAIDYRRIASVDELVGELGRLGITHVVREDEPPKPAANPIGAHVTDLWDGLLARCEKVGAADAGSLYRLAPALAGARRPGSA